MDIQKLKDRIQPEEGFRAKPYRDTKGILTIGYGRNLEGVGIRPTELEYLQRTLADIEENGITEQEADYLLSNDIKAAVDVCSSYFDWFDSLDDARQMVVADMVFNIGLHKFMQFEKTIGCINCGDFDGAAKEMLNSAWARQVGQRAAALARMMREGA